jgi:hypothetical protein
MNTHHTITIPIGEPDQEQYIRDLRRNLNLLLSMALAGNELDLDKTETEALRGVSDFMLALHLAEDASRRETE